MVSADQIKAKIGNQSLPVHVEDKSIFGMNIIESKAMPMSSDGSRNNKFTDHFRS